MIKKFLERFEALINLILGNIGAQVINILLIPVIARIFSPEDIGQLTLFISILAIINVFVTLKLELAIPLEVQTNKLANLLVGCITILGFVIVLTYILFFALISFDILDTKLYYLLPLMLLGEGIYIICVYFSIRFENYKGIAVSKLNKSAITNGVQISLGLFNSNSISLVVGDALGRFLGANKLIKNLFYFLKVNREEISLGKIFSVVRTYKNFPIYSTWSAFFNSSAQQVFPIFLGLVYGNYYLGIYAMTQRVLGAPLGLLTHAIGQYFLGNASKLVRINEFSKLKAIFYKYVFVLFVINIFIVSLVIITGDPLIVLFLGEEWTEVTNVLKIISVMLIFQFTISPVSQILNILKQQRTQMIWDVSRFIIVATSLWYIFEFSLTFIQTVKIYSYIIITTYLFLFITISIVLKSKKYNVVS